MPLLWLSLTFLVGVWLGAQFELAPRAWLLTAGGVMLLGMAGRQLRSISVLLPGLVRWFASAVPFGLLRLYVRGSGFWSRRKLPLPGFVLFAAIALGALRYQVGLPDLSAAGFITAHIVPGQEYVLEGIIAKPPDQRDRYTNLTVQVEELRPLAAGLFVPVEGMLLAQVSAHGGWEYGHRGGMRSPTGSTWLAKGSMLTCSRGVPTACCAVRVSSFWDGSTRCGAERWR
jgi:hypothetical protein